MNILGFSIIRAIVARGEQLWPDSSWTIDHTAGEVKTSVADNRSSLGRDVAAGNGDVVHDGRIYTHPPGVGDSVRPDTRDTGSTNRLTFI
jgi:hypothetical protein